MELIADDTLRGAFDTAGLPFPDREPEPGELLRFPTNGRAGDTAGWCRVFPDAEGAAFGCWRTGAAFTWQRRREGPPPTAEESARWRAKAEESRRMAEADRERVYVEAAGRAADEWDKARAPDPEHGYLLAKSISGEGLRQDADKRLLVPVYDAAGNLQSVQYISADGAKRFLPGGKMAGGRCWLGELAGTGPAVLAEGFATAASIRQATGWPVCAAFSAGNLRRVAESVRRQYPAAEIFVAADDDHRTEGNPGLTKASEAAEAVKGKLIVPDFGADRPAGATDFNDLALLRGAEAVRAAMGRVRAAETSANGESSPAGDSASHAWPEPQPLSAKVEPEDYPLDALPETIRAAVQEVAGFVKAPLPMVVSSALGALSLACQAHVDVKRAEKLTGPVSLFLLTIGDSGERKSTCDGFFITAIREHQEQQAEAMKPEIERHQAEMDAWTAERNGILEAIKAAGKSGKSTDDLRASLAQLQHAKPEAPRVPRLLLGDETPENLAWRLAREWPSAGVVSSEAGLILGAHGMGKDSVMRNLSLLNVLWDGGELSIGRRTSESFTVKGARLTVALQIQEPTLRNFFDKSGVLARGSGFLARFLVAWPESTQGYRPFSEAPANWPHLAKFHRRIAEILNQPAPIGDDVALTPQMLILTPAAKAAWVAYHDAIEKELRAGGELYDVRDVASKSADNAVRLAALFHVFEHGAGAVGPEAFEGASRIAAWHLNESRRFFGELALPAELADAARLDSWLIEHCQRERTHLVGKSFAMQYGPLRKRDTLDAAIRELAELDRLQVRKDGKRATLAINPSLLGFVEEQRCNSANPAKTRRVGYVSGVLKVI